jgi:hypothetical protein
MNICAEDSSDNYTIQWTIPSGTIFHWQNK